MAVSPDELQTEAVELLHVGQGRRAPREHGSPVDGPRPAHLAGAARARAAPAQRRQLVEALVAVGPDDAHQAMLRVEVNGGRRAPICLVAVHKRSPDGSCVRVTLYATLTVIFYARCMVMAIGGSHNVRTAHRGCVRNTGSALAKLRRRLSTLVQ